ncbi:Alpha/beta-hydrolases family protein isoform 1 [Hibiscus syriacus]|uniref:Alpha/beta-hydrolases family protein isoform 1 n=1 Tax=Hibiscus syriacus TaxID=106335 RepID=A0A6A3CEK5_HIBSY|nr:Alpha/beta-hydrolases family protein isoform 1 [Hibiscus syriacus]
MAFSESESVAYGGSKKTGSPIQVPESAHDELTRSSSLNKQNSIFSFTFDEIQLQSWKTFGSMNMDDFLANLWNVEENQQVPSQLDQTGGGKGIGSQPTPSLARQGSFSIPSPLCKRTVDEVWFEIEKELPQQGEANNMVDRVVEESSGRNKPASSRINGPSLDANYGMGHVTGSSQQKMLAPTQKNNASMDANFGMGHVLGLGFHGHQIVGNNLAIGNGYAAAGYPIFIQSKAIMGESSNGPQNGNGTNSLLNPAAAQNKKRIIDGPPEVVMERRQCRMIQNQESAARSRARKQAYTVELELELNQLKQENAKLKQLVVLKRKKWRSTTLSRTVSTGW